MTLPPPAVWHVTRVKLINSETICVTLWPRSGPVPGGIGLPWEDELERLQQQVEGQKQLHATMVREVQRLHRDLRRVRRRARLALRLLEDARGGRAIGAICPSCRRLSLASEPATPHGPQSSHPLFGSFPPIPPPPAPLFRLGLPLRPSIFAPRLWGGSCSKCKRPHPGPDCPSDRRTRLSPRTVGLLLRQLIATEDLERQWLRESALLEGRELVARRLLTAHSLHGAAKLNPDHRRRRHTEPAVPALEDPDGEGVHRSSSVATDPFDIHFVATACGEPAVAAVPLVPNAFGFFGRGDCHPCDGASIGDVDPLLILPEPERTLALLRVVTQTGLTPESRARVWTAVSGSEELKWEHQPDLYRRLLQHAPNLDHQRAILLDVRRTFIDHRLFCRPRHGADSRPAQAGESRLYNVLAAYCRLDPGTGYRQGMNFLAAMLVSVCYPDDEAAFWLFVALMQRHQWVLLFDAQSHGLDVLLGSLAQCLPPEVAGHLLLHGLPPSLFAPNWLQTLFTASFECWAAVLLIWDVMWILGASAQVPLRITAQALKHFGPEITAQQDLIALVVYLQQTLPREAFHLPVLLDLLSSLWPWAWPKPSPSLPEPPSHGPPALDPPAPAPLARADLEGDPTAV